MSIMFSKSSLKIGRVSDIPLTVRFAFDEINVVHSDPIYTEIEVGGCGSRVKSPVMFMAVPRD